MADSRFRREHFTYSHVNGFGHVYQSDYSFSVIVAYIFAYLAGVVAYIVAAKNVSLSVRTAGIVICLLGVASFLVEASHWVLDHNFSWIASFPVVLIVLAAVAVIQISRQTAPSRAVESD